MKEAIREISLQRVTMRYEMLRKPIAEEELRDYLKARGAKF